MGVAVFQNAAVRCALPELTQRGTNCAFAALAPMSALGWSLVIVRPSVLPLVRTERRAGL